MIGIKGLFLRFVSYLKVFVFLCLINHTHASRTLHLFSWWGMFPPSIIEQFEKETGITVVHDLMESNEALDAKLSAGYTGYDLVTPSFIPFAARQLQGGLYQPLNKDLIPHFKGIDKDILQRMTKGDPYNNHSVPVVWGTVGLSYNVNKIKALLPHAPLKSWRLLFDPEYVKHMASCRVTLLEEPYDLLVPALLTWGLPLQLTPPLIKDITSHLKRVRPYIHRFDSLRSANDLFEGNVCMVMQWTGGVEHARAQLSDPTSRPDIVTLIPDEGTVMWIDTLMIPHDAPHPLEAHIFIDFILRPDIMAAITNKTHYANTVPASLPLVDEAIARHPALYPNEEMMKKVHLNALESPHVMRLINRLMMHLRRGQ